MSNIFIVDVITKHVTLSPQRVHYDRKHGASVTESSRWRKLQVCCTPDGTWGEIGRFENQEALRKKADGLRSRLDTYGKEKGTRWRWRVRRKMFGVLQKVINCTANLHNKVCSWVVNS